MVESVAAPQFRTSIEGPAAILSIRLLRSMPIRADSAQQCSGRALITNRITCAYIHD